MLVNIWDKLTTKRKLQNTKQKIIGFENTELLND